MQNRRKRNENLGRTGFSFLDAGSIFIFSLNHFLAHCQSLPLMLLFKKKFLEAIRSGSKTQTIRLWKHRRMKPGQRSYIPGIGYIRIGTVEQIELQDLTDEDAKLDGFDSACLLKSELDQLYSKQITEGHQVYRVVFQVLPPDEQKKC